MPPLPHNLDAERAVLGAVLQDPAALPRAAQHVTADDFYHPALSLAFAAASALREDGEPVDLVTVPERAAAIAAARKGKVPVNLVALLVEACDAMVVADNVAWHAQRVAEQAQLRALIQAADEARAAAHEPGADPVEVAARAQAAIHGAARGQSAGKLVTQHQSVTAALRSFDQAIEARKGRGTSPAIPTGFQALDALLQGGWRRVYAVIGARPSMGKTSFAMDCAEAAAKFGGAAVLVVSLEMDHDALSLRRISAASGVNGYALNTGDVDGEAILRVTRAAGPLMRLPIWYHDKSPKLETVLGAIRSWASDPDMAGGFERRLVVVDYAGLVEYESARRSSNREQDVSHISRSLKAVQREIGGSLICLSQLNRELEKRGNKRPVLSDLRESGSLEQDADVIAFLYRDEVYNPQSSEKGIAEVIIGKQRNGPLGVVKLGWDAPRTRFVER